MLGDYYTIWELGLQNINPVKEVGRPCINAYKTPLLQNTVLATFNGIVASQRQKFLFDGILQKYSNKRTRDDDVWDAMV